MCTSPYDLIWGILPHEFKGIWLYKGVEPIGMKLSRRFDPAPMDNNDDWIWVSRETIEKEYGKIENVIVNIEFWDEIIYTIPPRILIYTEKNIVMISEELYSEYLVGVPRDWRILIKGR